jgi:flagellar protein FlaG
MSVELTGMAIDTLSINPQKTNDHDPQARKDLVGSELSVKNKSIRVIEGLAPEHIDKVEKKEKATEHRGITAPQLENVAKQLQEFIGKMNQGLEFLVDEDSGRDVIKVIDKNSGELIKQYPSEEVLSLVSKLSAATGNFVDSKA